MRYLSGMRRSRTLNSPVSMRPCASPQPGVREVGVMVGVSEGGAERAGGADGVDVAVLAAVGAGEAVAVADGSEVALGSDGVAGGKCVACAALQAARIVPAIKSPNIILRINYDISHFVRQNGRCRNLLIPAFAQQKWGLLYPT